MRPAISLSTFNYLIKTIVVSQETMNFMPRMKEIIKAPTDCVVSNQNSRQKLVDLSAAPSRTVNIFVALGPLKLDILDLYRKHNVCRQHVCALLSSNTLMLGNYIKMQI